MPGSGRFRQQLANTLKAAYADGLISEETLAHRLDALLGASIIDPARLVSDLPIRPPGWKAIALRVARLFDRPPDDAPLLSLDWSGAQHELVIGRHSSCDIRLAPMTVSRQHARLVFRDGGWTLQDLDSTNGTMVNGVPVGRCRLTPGDDLTVADVAFRVD